MVVIHPFKAIRPANKYSEQVASLPYDVLSSEEARELGSASPYSYLHIDKAEIDLPETISPYDEQVYQQAAANLQRFLEKAWLIQEDTLYFIYMN